MMKTVLVDLDGTLAQYDGWKGVSVIGDPIKGAREFIIELCKQYKVVIYTCRTNSELNSEKKEQLIQYVRDWLIKWHFPQVDIFEGNKPHGTAYIDDKALRCDAQDYNGVYDIILSVLS